jgi:microcystin-dependent protein
MSDQYLGEIRIFGFNFAPQGWALCNGQLMSISQNTALFSLIGTYYGGDGVNTFGLPNLQSRVPIHQGQGSGLSPYVLGQQSGVENVTLTSQQMPQHNHLVNCNGASTAKGGSVFDVGIGQNPVGNFPGLAASPANAVYATVLAANNTMNANMITYAGSNQPHPNIQPYLTVSFCISLVGIYPTRG